MLCFLSTLQDNDSFQSGYIHAYSPQCMSVPTAVYPPEYLIYLEFILSSLADVQWYTIAILSAFPWLLGRLRICHLLFFFLFSYLVSLLWKSLIKSPPFSRWVACLFLTDLWESLDINHFSVTCVAHIVSQHCSWNCLCQHFFIMTLLAPCFLVFYNEERFLILMC